MSGFEGYAVALEQLVRSGEQRVAMELFGLDGTVELLEGESTVEEALDYAALMFELGMDAVAQDVLTAVLTARPEGYQLLGHSRIVA